jgi:hypothetical protein
MRRVIAIALLALAAPGAAQERPGGPVDVPCIVTSGSGGDEPARLAQLTVRRTADVAVVTLASRRAPAPLATPSNRTRRRWRASQRRSNPLASIR